MNVRFVTKKVAGSLLTVAFVLVFNFFLFRVVEADPVATLYRGRNLSAQQRAKLRHDFGVDQSTGAQFVKYLDQTAHFNLGISYESRRPVKSEIADAFWPTVWLVGISTVLSTVLGVLAGIYSGWRRGSKFDYAATSFTMLTYAMPDFWLGLLILVAFGITLGWFPIGGIHSTGAHPGISGVIDYLRHMFLPCLTLTLAYLGEFSIVMRSSILETLGEDYLLVARAKGLRDALVRRRHAVPNALLPVVTLIAINFGFVLSGAIAVESVYSWPGLGRLTYTAINAPDLPLLQGLFLLFSVSVIIANLGADLLYSSLDPRVRN